MLQASNESRGFYGIGVLILVGQYRSLIRFSFDFAEKELELLNEFGVVEKDDGLTAFVKQVDKNHRC